VNRFEKRKQDYIKTVNGFKDSIRQQIGSIYIYNVLSNNPFCTVSNKEVATEVDHIVPLAEDYSLRLTVSTVNGYVGSVIRSRR
jgi:hypothetical protein